MAEGCRGTGSCDPQAAKANQSKITADARTATDLSGWPAGYSPRASVSVRECHPSAPRRTLRYEVIAAVVDDPGRDERVRVGAGVARPADLPEGNLVPVDRDPLPAIVV
jgi:hypothetical protein